MLQKLCQELGKATSPATYCWITKSATEAPVGGAYKYQKHPQTYLSFDSFPKVKIEIWQVNPHQSLFTMVCLSKICEAIMATLFVEGCFGIYP